MSNTVEVTIPVDLEAAQALKSPDRRDAAGRLLSGLLKEGRARALLEEAIRQAKGEARVGGLTDEGIDAELEAWRADRQP